jgi:NitT/TauT family transport system permease protein
MMVGRKAVSNVSSLRQVLVGSKTRGALSILAGLCLWQGAVWAFDLDPLVISPPSEIVQLLGQMLADGSLWPHVATSLQSFSVGLLSMIVLGVPLGLIMGMSRSTRDFLQPWITGLYAVPNLALAPLFIIWLGFGLSAKAAIVALVAFFPIVINAKAGVERLEAHHTEVGKAFGSTGREDFWKIVLPACIPSIATGIELAIGRGLVGVVVGDLFGARSGLGYLLLRGAQTFDTPTVFVATVMLAVLGLIFTAIVKALQRLASPWARRSDARSTSRLVLTPHGSPS